MKPIGSIERLRYQAVEKAKGGFVLVRQYDLKSLLNSYDSRDACLERLEVAVAALLLDIEDGASVNERCKGQFRGKGEAWPELMKVSDMVDRYIAYRRHRRQQLQSAQGTNHGA